MPRPSPQNSTIIVLLLHTSALQQQQLRRQPQCQQQQQQPQQRQQRSSCSSYSIIGGRLISNCNSSAFRNPLHIKALVRVTRDTCVWGWIDSCRHRTENPPLPFGYSVATLYHFEGLQLLTSTITLPDCYYTGYWRRYHQRAFHTYCNTRVRTRVL